MSTRKPFWNFGFLIFVFVQVAKMFLEMQYRVHRDVLAGMHTCLHAIKSWKQKSQDKKTKSKSLISLENELISILGTRVQLKMKNEKSGSISIEYFTNEDLDRILDLIRSINN